MAHKEPHQPGWLPDEMASAGRENLDVDHVNRYDEKEDAAAVDEVTLLKKWGLGHESLVVDLGAGTGQFTIAAASMCDRVVAVDVSPVMLDLLRTKVSHSGLVNVDIVRAGFLTYEHTLRKADVVYSRFALHHLPDFWKFMALKRIREILKPNGILRLWDVVYHFKPHEAENHLETWCAKVGDDADSKWSRVEVEEHIRDEHSTFTWLLEPMMERCNFRIEETEYSSDGFFAKYIARAT